MPDRPAAWPVWLTTERCPDCDAPLVRAGGPVRGQSVYRCPNAHDWLLSELRPAPVVVTQEELPL